jgi:uncharacterized sporulation protein YeaH/YhbH (DUF444 family)
MASVVENEAGRRRIRIGELSEILLSGANMPAIERENVDSIIRRLAREASAFDGVSRLIDRARTDSTILARLVAITRAESAQADGGDDEIRFE